MSGIEQSGHAEFLDFAELAKRLDDARKRIAELEAALRKAEQIARARIICDTGTPSQRHAVLDDVLAALGRGE